MSLFRREKLFRLVASTADRRNARGRKHTRQRKAAVIPHHQIHAHFGHIALKLGENLRCGAVVLNDRVMLLTAIAPFRRQTILEPKDARAASVP